MRNADTPTVCVEIEINAPADAVWALVSDIHLMAELSPELQAVEWTTGSGDVAVGREFTGRNFHKALGEWETTSTVIECTRPESFAWAVGDKDNPSAVWRFSLRGNGSSTVLSQSAQLGPARSGLSLAIDAMPDKKERIIERRLAEFRSAMENNLARIKQLSENEAH